MNVSQTTAAPNDIMSYHKAAGFSHAANNPLGFLQRMTGFSKKMRFFRKDTVVYISHEKTHTDDVSLVHLS